MQALLYEPLKDKKVKCRLCHHRCVIKDGRRGICAVRENRAGILETLVYGRVIANHVDPIEKKPLFHLLPGSLSYSIATVGCNFKCRFCQNADIAQMPVDHNSRIMGQTTSAKEVVAAAQASNCRSIAYTYTEPTIFFEFALDTAKLAHEHGLQNVFVTNGYMTGEALDMIGPYLDGANVDLKAHNADFYRKMCGAKLEHVKAALKQMKAMGIWVEVTTLLIPGLNDTPGELEQLAGFIATELGPETPWHISRFHPTYKLTDCPPTPMESLILARDIGKQAGLHHVYLGNIHGGQDENTFCPACGQLLIERMGYQISGHYLQQGRCNQCNTPVAGKWS